MYEINRFKSQLKIEKLDFKVMKHNIFLIGSILPLERVRVKDSWIKIYSLNLSFFIFYRKNRSKIVN